MPGDGGRLVLLEEVPGRDGVDARQPGGGAGVLAVLAHAQERILRAPHDLDRIRPGERALVALALGRRALEAAHDPQEGTAAVVAAQENARHNDVAGRIRVRGSEGYRGPQVRTFGPYDLIFANILADPLCDMARDLARHLAPSGTAILSGLFDRQAARVIDAHRAVGLRLRRYIQLEIWTTLMLRARRR